MRVVDSGQVSMLSLNSICCCLSQRRDHLPDPLTVPKYSTTDWELGALGFERKYPHRNKNIGVQI